MDLLEQRFPAEAGGSAVAVFAAPQGRQVTSYRAGVETALSQVAKIDHVASVSDPFATGRVSADGRVAFAEIALDVPSTEFGRATAAEVGKALEPARAGGVQAEFGGDAAFLNAEKKSSPAEAVGLLAALVILLVAFGTVVARLVPIVLALVAVGVGLGGIVVLAGGLTVSTAAPTIGAMVGLGVGIDYSLFIVSRYRENRTAGQVNPQALSAAMGTSGTAVFFAGGTVVLAMAALALTGVGFLASIGLGTSIVVLFAVGDRSHSPAGAAGAVGRPHRCRSGQRPASGRQGRRGHRVVAAGPPHLGPALAVPGRRRTRAPDAGCPGAVAQHRLPRRRRRPDRTDRANGVRPARRRLRTRLQRSSVRRRRPARHRAGAGDVPELAARIAADPGIAEVGEPRVSPNGDTVVLPTLPTTEPSDPATVQTLERIRSITPDGVYVTGATALTLDLDKQLTDTLPLFIGAILAASILLLMIVFRSVTVPLKAAVMNLLSIGAAYGVVVAVFQWGWLGGLFGLDSTYRIASPLPVIFFAVLFGLSMDYEVFLVTRIREAYQATGDNAESVARGLASTGRVITSGALIMVAVFLSFVTDPRRSSR
jgi:RND superfamily putative drug exporter